MNLRDVWFVFVLVATFLGLLTGQAALLYIGALLLTVIVLARYWNRHALDELHYERRFDEHRLFAGETVSLTLELSNRKRMPLLWVRVDDRFPEEMVPLERPLGSSGIPRTGLLSHVTALLWNERVRWHYKIPCEQRGFYFFGPAQLRSGDVFGIYESESVQDGQNRIIVYPRVEPLDRLGLPAKDPFGGQRVQLPVFEDPTRVVGARDYRPDDPMRRVHWKASARLQRLQVRVWEPTQERQLVVILNVATFEKHWQGIDRSLLERTISVAASICLHAEEERHAVGLIANASVPQSDQAVKVAPGRSPHQMRYILEALAAVTSFATMPVERLLQSESPRLGWGATLVVVTAVVSEPLRAEMVRLHRAGRRLALVSLDGAFDAAEAEALRAHGIPVHLLVERTPTPTARLDEPAFSRLPASDQHPHAAYRPPPPESRNGHGRRA